MLAIYLDRSRPLWCHLLVPSQYFTEHHKMWLSQILLSRPWVVVIVLQELIHSWLVRLRYTNLLHLGQYMYVLLFWLINYKLYFILGPILTSTARHFVSLWITQQQPGGLTVTKQFRMKVSFHNLEFNNDCSIHSYVFNCQLKHVNPIKHLAHNDIEGTIRR